MLTNRSRLRIERHEDERPDEVELLLDRQAPQVAQQRRIGGVVGHVAEDLAPVAEVEQRPRQVASHVASRRRRADDQRDGGDHQQHHEEGRQQPAGPPQPELSEVDPAVALALLDQQGRDEEAGHDEEDLDADPPAGHPAEAGVVAEHDQHRQGPQAVEARLVPEAAGPAPAALQHPPGAVVGLVGAAQRTRGDVGAQHPPQGPGVVAEPVGLDDGARDLARRVGNPRHVRTAVPVGVVSTIQPSACSSARMRVGGGEVLGGARRVERGGLGRDVGGHLAAVRPSTSPTAPHISMRPRRPAAPASASPASSAALARRTVSNSTAIAAGRVEVVVHRARGTRASTAGVGVGGVERRPCAAANESRPASALTRRPRGCRRRRDRAAVVASAAAACGRHAGRSARSGRAGWSTLPRLFDIFSPSASTTKPLCIQWLAKRLPSATAWARSFSWCGKLQVHAAAVQVEALAQQVEAHHDALAVPTRPAVAPRRRPRRLARLGQLPQHEVGRVALAARRRTPRGRRRRRACRRGSGGPAGRSRAPSATARYTPSSVR